MVAAWIYGISLICLYLVSGIYHVSQPSLFKKIMQVIDHCTIYFLIMGSYMPILLGPVHDASGWLCWVLLVIVCLLSAIGIVFTAIDLDKYEKLSMICYLGIGWLSVLWLKTLIKAISFKGFIYLLAGGIAYTIGAIFYRLGGKRNIRYMHSVFHVFVLIGTFLQFVCIFHFCILY